MPIVYREVYVKEDVDITMKRKVCFLSSNDSLLVCYALATLYYLVMNYSLKSLNVIGFLSHRDGLGQEHSPKPEDD